MRSATTRLAAALVVSLSVASLCFGQQDVAGSKDHPLFTRMPGFYIASYDQSDFDSYTFRDEKFGEVKVEGRHVHIGYELKPGAPAPSSVQIHRNYRNAILKVGGAVVFGNDEYSYLRLVRDGREIWVEVTAYGPRPDLHIVEKAGMKQEVVASADAFSKDIESTGHAAVYGIYFDTGKSAIKPESAAAIGEVAKLLKGHPRLAVHIVGHTDNVGTFESNMKLSQDRANAVVQDLVGKHAIPAARLKAAGVGPLAPVASNDSDDGRAKNRRVELVKQ